MAELLRQAIATVLIVALVIAGAGLVPFLAAQIPAGLVALAIAVVLRAADGPAAAAASSRRPGGRWCARRCPTRSRSRSAALYFRIVIVLMSLVSTDEPDRLLRDLIPRDRGAGRASRCCSSARAFPVMSRAARDDADRLLYAGQRTFDLMMIVRRVADAERGARRRVHDPGDRRRRLRAVGRRAADPGARRSRARSSRSRAGSCCCRCAATARSCSATSCRSRSAWRSRSCSRPVGRRRRRSDRDRRRRGRARGRGARAGARVGSLGACRSRSTC